MMYKQLARTTTAALAMAAAAAWAAPSASAPDTIVNASIGVEAEIVQGLGFSLHSTPLAFGGVIIDSAGTCTVDAATEALTCAGATPVPGAGQGPTAAKTFTLTGGDNRFYSISFPLGTIQLSGPGADMDVDAFTHNAGGSPQLDGNGEGSFQVGATVHYALGQLSGDYAGTFSVSVAYQ